MSDDKPTADPAPQPPPEPVVRTADLFGDHKEIVIEHDGERYKLRITRRGRLILQK